MSTGESRTVDLKIGGKKRQFDIDPFVKHCLLNGLDDIGLTLEHARSIDTYETSQRGTQPWLWA